MPDNLSACLMFFGSRCISLQRSELDKRWWFFFDGERKVVLWILNAKKTAFFELKFFEEFVLVLRNTIFYKFENSFLVALSKVFRQIFMDVLWSFGSREYFISRLELIARDDFFLMLKKGVSTSFAHPGGTQIWIHVFFEKKTPKKVLNLVFNFEA